MWFSVVVFYEVFGLLAPIQVNIKVGGPTFKYGNKVGNGAEYYNWGIFFGKNFVCSHYSYLYQLRSV